MSGNGAPVLIDACEPRQDVLEGRLEEDHFAASISAVAHDPENTPAIYSDAEEFYEKTYPTDGLVELNESIVKGILDFEGIETDGTHSNIVGLDTTFGGGKTHDLIAAYHLANDPDNIDNLTDFIDGELADEYLSLNTDINTAVIDGEDISGNSARSTDDAEHPPTKTIWGEIIYQLFGMDGYREVEEIDNNRNVPAGGQLKRLFQATDDYNVILLDELALYLEDAAAIEVEGSNLANQTTTFIFRLLGAISQVDNVTLVYSISESAYEDRADELREKIAEAQEDVGEIFKRKHRVITPTGDTEVGAVLRQRLFATIDVDAASDFADAYNQYYREFPRTLPSRAEEPQYREKLEREYPFHPELISTLTNKVDSIPKFQKTRGALKLLASAIHHLWENPPDAYDRHVLRTYDLTPAEPIIRKEISELTEVLEKLDAAVKADVYNDDGDSFGQQEDERWNERSLPSLGSHITVTVLWNSLAAGKHAVGVTYSELYLHVGHPALQMDHYDTARDNLTYKNDIEYACHFLYDEDRVQFKGIPNVVRIIEQRKENISPAQAESEVQRNVQNAIGTGPFNPVKFPQHVSEIPDESDQPSLCVLKFDVAEVDGSSADTPPEIIDRFYKNTASSYDGQVQPRDYKNYALFLVPDQGEITTAIDKARMYLAQVEIRDDEESLPDLTDEQVDQLDNRIHKSKNLMREKARTAYRHLYVAGTDGELEHITISSVSGNGRGDFQSSVIEALDDIDRVITAEDEGKTGLWVEKTVWQQNRTRMTTQALQDQFAKKPGLPILLNPKPLRKTIAKIVEEDGYAYWDAEQGKVYWNPDNDTPSNWEHDVALEESSDVLTDITHQNVKISDSHVVYDSIESFLDEETIEIPEEEADEGGDGDGDGTKPPESDSGPEPGETWSVDKGPADGSIALEQAHHEAVGNGYEGLTSLGIEVHGEKKFARLDYLTGRRSIKDNELSIGVMFNGNTASDGDTSQVNIQVQGGVEAFESIGHSTLDQLQDRFEDPETAAELTLEFDPPERLQPADADEKDVIAALAEEIEDTGLTLHVRAEGVKRIEAGDTEGEA